MTLLVVLAGIVVAGLFVYLIVAFLNPEAFE